MKMTAVVDAGIRPYLVCYYGPAGGSCVCCDLEAPTSSSQFLFRSVSFPRDLGSYHNALIVNASNDCSTSAGGFGERNAPGVERRITVVIGEVEAWHGCDPVVGKILERGKLKKDGTQVNMRRSEVSCLRFPSDEAPGSLDRAARQSHDRPTTRILLIPMMEN